MNFKSQFLTLPMREQICLVIIILTMISVLIIISLTCSFCYEILKVDYNKKKLYFYDKYKEYIEATFYFQNFCLLQYEEIIKRMQKQIFQFQNNLLKFQIPSNFNPYNAEEVVISFNPQNGNNNEQENDTDNNSLFYLCYSSQQLYCIKYQYFVALQYDSFTSLIMAGDIDKRFRMPLYDIPILKPSIIINVNYSVMFSYSSSQIKENINNIFGNINNYNPADLDKYYKNKIEYMMHNIYIMFLYFFQDVLFLFDHMFNKTIQEINSLEEVSIIDRSNPITFFEFSKIISGYYSSVSFPNDKFSLISYDYVNGHYYYFESSMIDDYLFFLHNKLSTYYDIIFIPLHYENNTIITPELCVLLFLKINNYQVDEEQIVEIYNKLIKGESNITDCFNIKDIFKGQLKIKEVFDINCSHFMTVNNYIYEGALTGGDYPVYYIKYTYPNYNVLKEFHSDYLLLDQVNFYLFASFKDPIMFSEYVLQLNKNIFMFIVILIFYIWVICLIVNLLIFSRVIIQLTDPIKNLQEAIESSSIKDENNFKYEYDEFINDLFLTCKELLNGQIENSNNEKGLGQFNILSIPKDKTNIDSNFYQKNFIINNDIMNQLINEQQNTMDFSKNIQINEALDKNNDNNFYENNLIKSKSKDKKMIEDNLVLSHKNKGEIDKETNEEKDNRNSIKLNKINEEEMRKPYKKLFQIAEYLYYYQNKIENNYIQIISNNIVKDESKRSNISRLSNNLNVNGSLKINPKFKKTIIKGDILKSEGDENFTINMLTNNDFSYLWYMEAKKKKNKSLSYLVNNNYDELFIDSYNYQTHEKNRKND